MFTVRCNLISLLFRVEDRVSLRWQNDKISSVAVPTVTVATKAHHPTCCLQRGLPGLDDLATLDAPALRVKARHDNCVVLNHTTHQTLKCSMFLVLIWVISATRHIGDGHSAGRIHRSNRMPELLTLITTFFLSLILLTADDDLRYLTAPSWNEKPVHQYRDTYSVKVKVLRVVYPSNRTIHVN